MNDGHGSGGKSEEKQEQSGFHGRGNSIAGAARCFGRFLLIVALLTVIGLYSLGAAQVFVATNANIPVPVSAWWENFTSPAPSDDSVEEYNPPAKWKWPWRPTETLTNRVPCCGPGTGPAAPVYRFQLDVTTNSFTTTNFSLRLTNNFPPYLPAFTNAAGENDTNWFSWRVTYFDQSNTVTLSTGAIYRFRISPTAKRFDRWDLRDRDYQSNRFRHHPHLLYTASERTTATNYLATNDVVNAGWDRGNFFAGVNSYTNEPSLTTNGNGYRTNIVSDNAGVFVGQSANVSTSDDTILVNGDVPDSLLVVVFGTNCPAGISHNALYYTDRVGYDAASNVTTNRLMTYASGGTVAADITASGSGWFALLYQRGRLIFTNSATYVDTSANTITVDGVVATYARITLESSNPPGGTADQGGYLVTNAVFDITTGRTTFELTDSSAYPSFGVPIDITSAGSGTTYIHLGEEAAVVLVIQKVSALAFAWDITGNTNYYGTTPGTMLPNLLDACARDIVRIGMDHKTDAYSGGMWGRAMAIAYDFLYSNMSPAQVTNVITAMTNQASYLFYQFGSFFHETNATKIMNRDFSPPHEAADHAAQMNGDGHGRLNRAEILYIWYACGAEAPVMAPIGEFAIGDLINRFDPLRTDEGDYYGFGTTRGYINHGYLLTMKMFPVMTNMVAGAELMEMLAQRYPVGYRFFLNFHGDLGGYVETSLAHVETFGINARIKGRGDLKRHRLNSRMFRSDADISPIEGSATFFMQFPGDVAESDMAKGYVSPHHGWAVAHSISPSSTNSFTDGLSFTLTGQPYVPTTGHASLHNGAPRYLAFGAHVTEAGVENYQKHSMFLPGYFANGVGAHPVSKSWPGYWPYHNFIVAFTNSDDAALPFAYAVSDTTRSFNRKGAASMAELGHDYYNLSGAAAHEQNQITQMRTTVAFPMKKFWVELGSMTATQATRFTKHVNVRLPNLVTNGPVGRFSYGVTNLYHGGTVTVHVAFSDAANLTWTNLNWTVGNSNWYRVNPITGENYQFAFPDTYPTMSNNIWISRAALVTNSFINSIWIPKRWDQPYVPIIEELDALTWRVTDHDLGLTNVIVSWDTNNASGGSGSYTSAEFVFNPQSSLPPPNTNPPSNIVFESATPGNQQVALVWSDSDNEDGYHLHYYPTAGGATNTASYGVNVLGGTIGSLVNGTSYSFKLMATNATYGNSDLATTNGMPAEVQGGGGETPQSTAGGIITLRGGIELRGGVNIR